MINLSSLKNNINTINIKKSGRKIEDYYKNGENNNPLINNNTNSKIQLRGYDKSTWIYDKDNKERWSNNHGCSKNPIISVSSILSHLYCPRCAFIYFKEGQFIQTIQTLQGQISHFLIERLFANEEVLGKARNNEKIYSNRCKNLLESIKSIAKVKFLDECIKLNSDFDSFWHIAEESIRNKLSDLLISNERIPKRQYEPLLKSNSLGLKGRIDLLEDGQIPIEIKTGKSPLSGINYSDAIQLASYALLIENTRSFDVDIGYVYYSKIGKRRKLLIDDKIRALVIKHRKETLLTFLSKNTPYGRCYKCIKLESKNQRIEANNNTENIAMNIKIINVAIIVILIVKIPAII